MVEASAIDGPRFKWARIFPIEVARLKAGWHPTLPLMSEPNIGFSRGLTGNIRKHANSIMCDVSAELALGYVS
jgi:hypothetical protein